MSAAPTNLNGVLVETGTPLDERANAPARLGGR